MQCPQCLEIVEADQQACPTCRAPLVGSCVHCGSKIERSAESCPSCRKATGAAEAAPVPGDQTRREPPGFLRDGAQDDADTMATIRVSIVSPGTTIGDRYRIEKLLGQGGMGKVFLATDLVVGTSVALKFLSPYFAQRESIVDGLRREMRVAMEVTHRNIVRLYDLESTEEHKFLKMEYIDGRDLADLLRERSEKGERPGLEEILPIVRQLCDALEYLHEMHVVHRDVKPGNVMIDAEGVAKLTDLGTAFVIHDTANGGAGDIVGTLPYMSPEQIQGDADLDGRSDIYSLGCLVYHLLSGKPPFCRGEIGFQHLYKTPRPLPDVEPWVNETLLAALAKNPKERTQTARDFYEGLNGERWHKQQPRRRIEAEAATVYEAWPFDAEEARRRQEETAEAIGAPVQLEEDLGGGVMLNLALIPAGEFIMGSPRSEKRRDSSEAQHRVRIPKPFYVSRYPLTQAQWVAVTDQAPDLDGDDTKPVVGISWADCQQFLEALNGRLGELEGRRYALPSEAQWEYVCRAGTETPFCMGGSLLAERANYNGEYPYGGSSRGVYRAEATPVGTFSPNAWGLHDVHGNVWEWCQDWYGEYPRGEVSAPTGPAKGLVRVVRGGSWAREAENCRSARRFRRSPDDRAEDLGFRLVLELGTD